MSERRTERNKGERHQDGRFTYDRTKKAGPALRGDEGGGKKEKEGQRCPA